MGWFIAFMAEVKEGKTCPRLPGPEGVGLAGGGPYIQINTAAHTRGISGRKPPGANLHSLH